MAVFAVRYDLRCPDDAGVDRATLYATALEQCAWADQHGFMTLVLSEHHGVDDGYLPSPLPFAGAVAARTSNAIITVAALLAPLYDPIRLAEDMVVLDHLSRGRVGYVMGLGYRREEYEAFGVDWSRRGVIMEECLTTLQAAFTGEPFTHRGRTLRVTPTPYTDPHPLLMYGGGSPAAARRAARFGMPFFPQHASAEIREIYEAACAEHGTAGFVLTPPEKTGTFVCAEEPDRFWAEHGDRLLYEARAYAAWQVGIDSAVHDTSTTVEEMQSAGVYRVVTPDEMITVAREADPMDAITLHPLIGGLDPDVAWESLRLVGDRVIPHV